MRQSLWLFAYKLGLRNEKLDLSQQLGHLVPGVSEPYKGVDQSECDNYDE